MMGLLRKPLAWGLILLVALGGGLAAWRMLAAPEAELPAAAAAPPSPYAAAANGKVDIEGGMIPVAARRAGIIRDVLVNEGDAVSQGQVLARQEDEEPRLAAARASAALGEARARLAGLEVALSTARRERERLAGLVGSNFVADQKMDQAEDQVRQAEADLASGHAAVDTARAALAQAQYELEQTMVRAPVDGYVLNLTQSTLGGVVGAGELLMVVVPSDAPLAVTARIKPDEIEGITAGMKARVTLTAFSTRRVSPFDAVVTNVSADELTDEKSGQSFYRADLKIDPKELAKLPKGETVTPGMPAQVMITTGRRTVMGYIVGPLTDTVNASMRDK